MWNCKCVCGNLTAVSGGNLKNKSSTSCGCFHKETISKNFFVDISGKRFGRLLTLKNIGLGKDGSYVWEFLCDCGNLYYNNSTKVTTGHTKSCGCLKTDFATENWSGKKSPKWNFNKTDEDRAGQRNISGYNEWRKQVYKRDNYTCQICKTSNGHGDSKLNAHHLESYQYNKELRCDVNNAITLCKKCHVDFHKKYSQVTTKKDFEDYLNVRNNTTI